MKLARTLITKTRALPLVTLKRAFCSKPAAPAPSVAPNGAASDKKEKEFQEQTLHLADGNKINIKFDDTSVSYELPDKIGGTTHHTSGQYMVMFTCNKCNTKQSKFFTKNAYHHGVVLIRCEGCHAVHLMADNLGWYGDKKTNIETIMKEKNSSVLLGNADPRLLDLLNQKAQETKQRFDDEQKIRQAKEAEEDERAKQQNPSKDEDDETETKEKKRWN